MSARVEISPGPDDAPRQPRRAAGGRRGFAAGFCLAVALVFTLEATGGVAADGRRPTAVESMARVPASDKRPTLRCWQYGRLVYEASDIQLFRDGHGDAADPAATAPTADRPNGRTDAKGGERPVAGTDGRRRVRLLDLNQGLCIID